VAKLKVAITHKKERNDAVIKLKVAVTHKIGKL
jgi:hypothetical protein